MAAEALEDLATTIACLDGWRRTARCAGSSTPPSYAGPGYYTGQLFEISHSEP